MQKSFSRAQGAIEYLLIIGAAILVVAVVIVAITSLSGTGRGQLDSGQDFTSGATDSLKDLTGNYFKINGSAQLKSTIGNGLVGLWHFDEGGGSTANNSYGGAGFGAVYNHTWGAGKWNTSTINFSGVNTYVSVPNSASLSPTTSVTLSAWVYARSLANAGHGYGVLSKGDSVFNDGDYEMLLLQTSPTNSVFFRIRGASPTYFSAGSIPLNAWAFIAATYDDATNAAVIYVNGVQVGNQAMTNPIMQNNGPLIIGVRHNQLGGGSFFNGFIEEPAVWNRALSAQEILDLYNAGS